MSEYKRVREEIAQKLHSDFGATCGYSGTEGYTWKRIPQNERDRWLEEADQILSLKGIEIRADSQEPFTKGYSADVEQMLKVGFVKVIPKPPTRE